MLQGKQDGCSPFYTTYLDEDSFRVFYEKELGQLKSNGSIVDFTAVEDEEAEVGFHVELASGSTVSIRFSEGEEVARPHSLLIDFRKGN